MQKEQVVVLGLITTIDGKHLVIRRQDSSDYGFPGGKANAGENMLDALVREIKEETGLTFDKEDFNLINGQVLHEHGVDKLIFTYGCKKRISDDAPLFTAEQHIRPMFMEPSLFYMLTSYKDYYEKLFSEQ